MSTRDGKRRPRTRTVLILVVVALVAGIGGCHFYRHWATGDLATTIRSMPGVTATDVSYNASIDGSHYYLYADLADDATPDQAVAAGRKFVDRLRFNALDGFDARLTVRYRHSLDVSALYDGSEAEFDYHCGLLSCAGPSSDDVAASVALWLQVAQSPAAAAVGLVQPSWGEAASSHDISVDIAPSATDAMIHDQIRAHPELARARWVFSLPAPENFGQPRAYAVRGPFPSRQLGELWRRIVDQIGDSSSARAGTNTIDVHPGLAPTEVEIDVGSGRDEAQRVEAVAHAVMPLLPGLGLPIRLRLNTIKFTLGGCEKPDHTPSALENELRRQYEHC